MPGIKQPVSGCSIPPFLHEPSTPSVTPPGKPPVSQKLTNFFKQVGVGVVYLATAPITVSIGLAWIGCALVHGLVKHGHFKETFASDMEPLKIGLGKPLKWLRKDADQGQAAEISRVAESQITRYSSTQRYASGYSNPQQKTDSSVTTSVSSVAPEIRTEQTNAFLIRPSSDFVPQYIMDPIMLSCRMTAQDKKDLFEEIKALVANMEAYGLDIRYDDANFKIKFGNAKHEILAVVEALAREDQKIADMFAMGGFGGRNIFNGDIKNVQMAKGNVFFGISRYGSNNNFLECINRFFSTYQVPVKDWSSIVGALDEHATIDDVLKKLLDLVDIPGICIGEGHSDPMPKKFLIEHMHTLRESGVTTLFLEHLCYDTPFQRELDKWFQSGGEMPLLVKLRLEQLDRGFHLKGEHTFSALVQAAITAGVRVVGIDTALSYECGQSDKFGVTDTPLRMKAMNFVAQEIIQKEKGKGKFVALMGNLHAITTNTIQGVPELVQALSLYVYSAKDDEPSGLHLNYEREIEGHFLKFDLALAEKK